MSFLFVFYLVGIFVAVYQDFTRREIDDWLNLFLFFSGLLFLAIEENLFFSSNLLVMFGFFIFIVSLLSFAFYYGRFFSGGDSKLFFAMSPVVFASFFDSSFFGSNIINPLFYMLFFIFSLFLCGSVYSLFYSAFLFFKDFKMAKVLLVKKLNNKKLYLIFSLIFLFMGFLDRIFIFIFFIFIFFIFLVCVAKTLEEVSLKRFIYTKDLREGDWLFNDIKIGKKMFKKSWDGLSAKDVSYLKRFNKKIFIKDGIPYAPAFLFALILFEFRNYLLGIIFS